MDDSKVMDKLGGSIPNKRSDMRPSLLAKNIKGMKESTS